MGGVGCAGRAQHRASGAAAVVARRRPAAHRQAAPPDRPIPARFGRRRPVRRLPGRPQPGRRLQHRPVPPRSWSGRRCTPPPTGSRTSESPPAASATTRPRTPHSAGLARRRRSSWSRRRSARLPGRWVSSPNPCRRATCLPTATPVRATGQAGARPPQLGRTGHAPRPGDRARRDRRLERDRSPAAPRHGGGTAVLRHRLHLDHAEPGVRFASARAPRRQRERQHRGSRDGSGVAGKIRAVVACTLGIDERLVRVEPTSISRIANMSPTAASTGSTSTDRRPARPA